MIRKCKKWKVGLGITLILTAYFCLVFLTGDQSNLFTIEEFTENNNRKSPGRVKNRQRNTATDKDLHAGLAMGIMAKAVKPLPKPISSSISINIRANADDVHSESNISLVAIAPVLTVDNSTANNNFQLGTFGEARPAKQNKTPLPDALGEQKRLDTDNLSIPSSKSNNSINVSRVIPYSDCALAAVKRPYTFPEYTAIVSAHGSGNTWARYLIERATGVSTGSYYHDPKLYKGGFLGEMANPRLRNTIAIKTHHPFQRKDITFQNAIVIVRDAFDVVVAERNRVVSNNGHVSVVSDSHFRGPDWEKFARGHARYWEHSCRECVTIPNFIIVYYSDLKSNLERELRRILKFLNVEPDEKRIACTLAYPQGKFKRKKKDRTFNPFSRELTEEINGHIRNVTALFESLDIAPLPFGEREYVFQLIGGLDGDQ